jgi:chaperonin GroES
MPDKYPMGIRITGEQPPISVGAAVNLSGPNSHAEFAPCSTLSI